MSRRLLLSPAERARILAVPASLLEIAEIHALTETDRRLVRSRRGAANQLGLALHLSLLRHPGFGWREEEPIPSALVAWLAQDIGVPATALADYTTRPATRSAHRRLAIAHLDLRPFSVDMHGAALAVATEAAQSTDQGGRIVAGLLAWCRAERLVPPSLDTLERFAAAGRARARRAAMRGVLDRLDATKRAELDRLLVADPERGVSPFAWMRDIPSAPSPDNLLGILERRRAVQALGLPDDLGDSVHPARFDKLAREGAAAPALLLTGFSPARRHASLAAHLVTLEASLSDATLAMFEALVAGIFSRSKRRKETKVQDAAGQSAKLMRLFGRTIAAIQTAVDGDADTFETIDAEVGWWKLLKVRGQVEALGALGEEDPLVAAARHHAYLRRFLPAFLEAFRFKAGRGGGTLLQAIEILRESDAAGRRALPDTAPMPFALRHWRGLIETEDGLDRRRYETAVAATLRERLRAGEVWVEGTRQYRRFDSYLVSVPAAREALAGHGYALGAKAWIAERRRLLDERLSTLSQGLEADSLDGVRLVDGQLSITPPEAVTPPEALALDRRIDAQMPPVRITELLWEVAERTGFLDAFRDLRTGKPHDNPAAVLATILAGATNLGLERMALSSSGVTHAQLTWASTWYLRPETYAEALARIVDAHHALPFTEVWAERDRSSSDGQFFPTARRAGEINAKYGPNPGVKIYSFLSGQYGPFASNVIGATAGEATHVLDGLVGGTIDFDPVEHFTDTGGASDLVFAMFHLLGLRFVPRLRDFPARRLACFGKPSRWGTLAPLMGKPIDTEVIADAWDNVLRVAAAIETGAVKPSEMMRKLSAHRQQDRLARALAEIGRIERSCFMVDWLCDRTLRQRCHAGLCKGEARHSLAGAVFAHTRGRIHDRSRLAQQNRASALNLVIAAIAFWNTTRLSAIVNRLTLDGAPPDRALLQHVSPLGWAHINLTGDYVWERPVLSEPSTAAPRPRSWRKSA